MNMYTKSILPPEIYSVMKQYSNYVLMIKGLPGTGKTLLSFEIADALKKDRTVFYLTSRTTPSNLYFIYPFTKTIFPPFRIVDSTSLPEESKDVISFKHLELPSYLRNLAQLIEKITVPATLIIDSIEGIKSNLGVKQSDYTLEINLVKISKSFDLSLVIVSEQNEIFPFDYEVDGIIKLSLVPKLYRYYRVLNILKLRGQRIFRFSYIFSLCSGRFRYLDPLIESFAESLKQIKNDKLITLDELKSSHDQRHVPTMIETVDEILRGGFRPGTLNMLEIQRNIGDRYDVFYLPMVINHILNGNPLLIIPTASMSAQSINQLLHIIFDKDVIQKLVKIVTFGKNNKTKNKTTINNTIRVPSNNLAEDLDFIISELNKFTDGLSNKNLLLIVGTDTLSHIYDEDQVDSIIGTFANQIKSSSYVALAIVKYKQKAIISLNHVVDTHFKVSNLASHPVFFGINPYTNFLYPLIIHNKPIPKVSFINIS